MSAQVYSVPLQTEGRSKVHLERKMHRLFPLLSLICGGNAYYYKSVHQPIPTNENREHLAIFKVNQQVLLSIEFSYFTF